MPRTQTTTSKRVGIWIRVSTEEQARGDSPENHERRARDYAAQKGWTVSTVYHLEGVSGKSVMRHRETERMLSDVKAKAISGLVFSKIARLARNTRELLEFWDVFDSCNADLVSLDESIDTSTPAGKVMYTMMGTLAEWERREIAGRVKASVPVRAKLGKSIGGVSPFGFVRQDGKLVIRETEAAVVRHIYELYAEHRRKGTVIRLLTKAGYRTRRGNKFNMRGLERLLTDPMYKGLRRMNYSQSKPGEYYKPQSEWLYIEVPPIVPEALWESCNAIMVERKVPGKLPAKQTAHLFSGCVVCKCGTKMYVRTAGKSYSCLACKNAVDKEALEEVFIEQLREFVISPAQIAEQVERADAELSSTDRLLEVAERERAQVAAEMKKLYQLYLDDHISGRLFAERNAPLEERFRQLDDEVPRLQAALDVLRLRIRSSDEMLQGAKDLYTRWPSLDFATKRVIIENVTDRILVEDNEITIELAYLPTTSDVARKHDAKRSHTVGGTRHQPP